MALNSNIILAGQQPDVVGSMHRGFTAGRENALAQMYKQHGAGIASGDRNALNALAAMDPMAARQIHNQNRDFELRQRSEGRQQQAFDLRMKEYAASLDAARAKAEAEKIKQGVFAASGAQTPEQWDQIVTQLGREELAGQFEMREPLLQQYMTAAKILEAQDSIGFDIPKGYMLADESNPGAGVISIPGFETEDKHVWVDPTPEEAARGVMQVNKETGAYKMAPKNMRLVSDGSGGFTLTEGVGSADADDNTMGLNVSGPQAMIDVIDGILKDPAFKVSTGVFAPLQNIPGTPQRRVGARIGQLDGQAFLNAFESLKGGGQITETEGKKATQAVGRLDSYQNPKDYREALTDLRKLLVIGQSRPKGWVHKREQEIPDVGTVENGYRFLGGNPLDRNNWEGVE